MAESIYRAALRRAKMDVQLEPDAVRALSLARAAVVASGTATLQSALLETPLVVVYRTGALNYALARRLVTIAHVALVNVLLGEEVVPEFVQGRARPADVARAAVRLIDDARTREAMLTRFREMRASLAGGDGAARVADMAMELASGRRA